MLLSVVERKVKYQLKIKNPAVRRLRDLAEKEGFEPSKPFRGLHDFQSCALDQLGDFSKFRSGKNRYSFFATAVLL